MNELHNYQFHLNYKYYLAPMLGLQDAVEASNASKTQLLFKTVTHGSITYF